MIAGAQWETRFMHQYEAKADRGLTCPPENLSNFDSSAKTWTLQAHG